MKVPDTSIIIPTYNRCEELAECLNEIAGQRYTGGRIEVIVVDGGSDDGTHEMVRRLIKKYPFVLQVVKQEKKGPANARNLGVKNSNGDIIIFLDSDCKPFGRNWAKTLATEAWMKKTLVGGRIIVPADTLVQRYIRSLHGFGTPDMGKSAIKIQQENFTSLPSTNMAFPRKLFEKVGGLDEKLIVGEDIDFCHNVVKIAPIHYIPNAVVHHTHQRTITGLLSHAYRGMRAMSKSTVWDKSMVRKNAIRLTIIPLIIAYLLVSIFHPIIFIAIPLFYTLLTIKFALRDSPRDASIFSALYVVHLLTESAGGWTGLMSRVTGNSTTDKL